MNGYDEEKSVSADAFSFDDEVEGGGGSSEFEAPARKGSDGKKKTKTPERLKRSKRVQKKLLEEGEKVGEEERQEEVEAAVAKDGKRKRKRKRSHAVGDDATLSVSKRDDVTDHQDNDELRKKKKKKGHRHLGKNKNNGKGKDVVVVDKSCSSKKVGPPLPFERIWKEEDELLLFKLMAHYKQTTGKEPSVKNPAFMEFLSENDGSFINKMSKEQVFNKIRYSKRKYYKNIHSGGPKFQASSDQEKEKFQLLKAIWPREKSLSAVVSGKNKNNNGVESLRVLEQWFVDGVKNVESPEERLQLESEWSEYKQQFINARLGLLKLVTSVSE